MHHRIMVRRERESKSEIAGFGGFNLPFPAISNRLESEKETPAQSLRTLFTDDGIVRWHRSRPSSSSRLPLRHGRRLTLPDPFLLLLYFSHYCAPDPPYTIFPFSLSSTVSTVRLRALRANVDGHGLKRQELIASCPRADALSSSPQANHDKRHASIPRCRRRGANRPRSATACRRRSGRGRPEGSP